MKRRDFLKTVASSGLVIAASDLVGDLLAQSPQGKPLESQFKGLADVALAEAKRSGCTYADIRFTRRTNSSVNANGGNSDFEGFGNFGGGGRGGRGGRGGAGWWRRRWLRRRGRDLGPGRRRLRRAGDSQRGLGLRQQPGRDRRRDPPDHQDRDRSGEGECDRQAARRDPGASPSVHRVPGPPRS